ncbi:MAG TPA: tetratricopeptide repeat protein [Bacteroidia bacterium]|nr:tetratricopeptide repeat protein [Bacteroidia bacterium]
MKKHYIFLILISILFVATIVITRGKEDKKPLLKMRSAKTSVSGEWTNTRTIIEGFESQLRSNPDNMEIKLKLCQAYIQEGRVTGDHDYYDALAFRLVNEVLKSEPLNFEALCSKATLQASAHQFSEALVTSQKAITINPYNSYIYGIMCDAYVELGNYEKAIQAGDKMVSIRPDLRSYSRISYLREILGDYPGAIEAMQMALDAGVPGLEQTEWVRTNLGKLYELTGKPGLAQQIYDEALAHRPFFAPALAGLGRVERSLKNYDKAIQYFSEASSMMKDYSFHHELAVTYHLAGMADKSISEYQIALDLLMKHKHPTNEENGIGHNIDRELALIYLSMGEYSNALNSARAEYEIRPDNIDVNEVLAWSYYKNGDTKAALSHILKALSTKSQNPELRYKAGEIFIANNKKELGTILISNALKQNPFLETKIFLNSQPGLASK